MNGQMGVVQWMTPIDSKYLELTVHIDGFEHPCSLVVDSDYFGKVKYEKEIQTKNKLKALHSMLNKHGHTTLNIFDFGYVITTHKSQGSEWDNVIVFEERFPKATDEEYSKWLYTAVTRAKKNLLLIGR